MKIYTKVEYKWDEHKQDYVEIASEYYHYYGSIAYCDMGGGSEEYSAPEISVQERELFTAQRNALETLTLRDKLAYPKALARMGYRYDRTKSIEYALQPMTNEEVQKVLSPTEYQQYISKQEFAKLQNRAITGDDFAFEADRPQMMEEYRLLKEAYARKGDIIEGDDPYTATAKSTPAMQALQSFRSRWDETKTNRRLEVLGMGRMGSGGAGAIGQTMSSGGYGGVSSGYNQMGARLQQERQLQTQLGYKQHQQKQNKELSERQAVGGLAGGIAGAAIGGYLTAWSPAGMSAGYGIGSGLGSYGAYIDYEYMDGMGYYYDDKTDYWGW